MNRRTFVGALMTVTLSVGHVAAIQPPPSTPIAVDKPPDAPTEPRAITPTGPPQPPAPRRPTDKTPAPSSCGVTVFMPYTMQAPRQGYTDTMLGRVGNWWTGGKDCRTEPTLAKIDDVRPATSAPSADAPAKQSGPDETNGESVRRSRLRDIIPVRATKDEAEGPPVERQKLMASLSNLRPQLAELASRPMINPAPAKQRTELQPVRPAQLRACDNSYRKGPPTPPFCKESCDNGSGQQ